MAALGTEARFDSSPVEHFCSILGKAEHLKKSQARENLCNHSLVCGVKSVVKGLLNERPSHSILPITATTVILAEIRGR